MKIREFAKDFLNNLKNNLNNLNSVSILLCRRKHVRHWVSPGVCLLGEYYIII